MRELRGKIALVTGAASGIGRATALSLARQGAVLILCDVDESRLKEVAGEVDGLSRCLLWRKVDVSSREEMRAFAEAVHQEVPAVDVLVNNAGIGMVGGLETPLEQWDRIIGINLMGVVYGCHFFGPRMAERGSGHIVNVASGLGFFGAPRILAYCATKFAVIGVSESLRAELRSKGIGVSVICPGIIATDIAARGTAVFGAQDAARAQARISRLFAKRGHPPESVANSIMSAIRHNRGTVPVTPDAWVIYYVKRFAPWLIDRFTGPFAARATGH
jgi:NAD(P)-dependent dehydrogenase (short-subunit alcohol dehydrogenase family)